MEKRKQKNDRILILVILAAAGFMLLGFRLYQMTGTREAEAVVLVNGREYGCFPFP